MPSTLSHNPTSSPSTGYLPVPPQVHLLPSLPIQCPVQLSVYQSIFQFISCSPTSPVTSAATSISTIHLPVHQPVQGSFHLPVHQLPHLVFALASVDMHRISCKMVSAEISIKCITLLCRQNGQDGPKTTQLEVCSTYCIRICCSSMDRHTSKSIMQNHAVYKNMICQ